MTSDQCYRIVQHDWVDAPGNSCRMAGKIADVMRNLDNSDKTLTRLYNTGIIDGYTGEFPV